MEGVGLVPLLHHCGNDKFRYLLCVGHYILLVRGSVRRDLRFHSSEGPMKLTESQVEELWKTGLL